MSQEIVIMLSKEQARESALYSLLLQVSVAPILLGWWLKYAWMQMLRALMVYVRCQWDTLLWLHVVRHIPMSAEQAHFSPCCMLLWCKFVLVKKCQRLELICSLWQSVEQEQAPVPLSGLRCRKVLKPQATLVLRDAALPLPRTTAVLQLCERSLQPPPHPPSNMFTKTGRERRREEGLPALSKRALFLW